MTSKLFKKVIYSGVQPSGSSGAHLGNYLGALRQWKVMQNQAAKDTIVLFALVDLHALSKLPQSCSRVTKAERQSSKAMLPSFVDNNRLMAATLLACDIDPQKSIIYRQSAVPQHTQLMWLLSCLTPISKLNRMTQYKDKAAEGDNLLSLLSYPVLMAADMLLFKATDVPVGDDQRQHLELTSDIVKAFNRFAKTQTFPIPKPIYGNDIANTRRIKNLSTPELKMSKSVGTDKSRICLSDTQDEIAKKISRAMTDSGNDVTYDPDNRPGIANLMDICAALLDKDAQQLLNEHQWQNASSLKQFTTDVLIEHVAPIGNRIRQYMKDPQELDSILKNGAERAETIANKNYKEIERVVGI